MTFPDLTQAEISQIAEATLYFLAVCWVVSVIGRLLRTNW